MKPSPHASAVRSVLVRALLGVLAVVVAGIPFLAAWQQRTDRLAVGDQITPAAAPPPAAGTPAIRSLPRDSGPVVLAYHDVRPDGEPPYTVTPAAFDAHLAALRAAGYRTLSTAAFVRHLRGATVPGRSVYLTFDDGAQGLWRHADRSLARHGMRAAAYLITGQVGEWHGYYLSWAEVRRMASSKRWDFQSHTDDLHRRLPLDASGDRRGPALTERLWLPAERRRETPAEYRTRVAGDLDRSIAAITSQGLPRPLLFAYPFSEAYGSGPSEAGDLHGMLRQRFTAALTNHRGARPLGAGARAFAERTVQRLEITSDTTAADLLAGLAERSPRPPGAVPRPLAAPSGWDFPGAPADTTVGAFTGAGPYPLERGHLSAEYLPLATADWTGYTAEASVGALHSTANGVSLTVRAHGVRPVVISLSRANLRVTEGTGAARRTVARARLEPAARHTLKVVVAAGRTDVHVDGRHRARVPVPPDATGGRSTGGIGLGVRNEGAPRWPVFRTLTVEVTRPAGAASDRTGHGRTAR
ncbi:polysaccharide deacetylase family protein [Streptomyces sp. t39]|uniref:polysaccharide deacetylase family protein n=1 Tax=Streptomyces sp. t39 TaxID=1828156 RepID=UPI0021C72277|nr:polysaccharide deacetylase family protein [Streptomyces sp. t39]